MTMSERLTVLEQGQLECKNEQQRLRETVDRQQEAIATLYSEVFQLPVAATASPRWRTMSSAPRDGEIILVREKGGEHPWVVRWCGWGGGCWQCAHTGHNLSQLEPTHWMPVDALLREAPEGKKST